MTDQAKNYKNTEPPSSNKWWEQYYVRYFVGTVVGALILVALGQYAQLHRDFQSFVPLSKVDAWGLAAVTAAGLAYCYIASAPILTLHALRGGLGFDSPIGSKMFFLFLAVLVGLPVLAIGMRYWLHSVAAFGWTLTLGIVIAQCVVILIAQQNRFVKINQFYDDLVDARLRERKEGTDYRDSYRHLREHGNAKSIILFEIFLGLIVASADSIETLIAVLILWLVPAAYVWFIATVIEFHFANRARPDADNTSASQH